MFYLQYSYPLVIVLLCCGKMVAGGYHSSVSWSPCRFTPVFLLGAASYAPDAFEPYAFIMQEDGKMLVHPSLTGENLMEKAPPVYQALMKANPEGVWVE